MAATDETWRATPLGWERGPWVLRARGAGYELYSRTRTGALAYHPSGRYATLATAQEAVLALEETHG